MIVILVVGLFSPVAGAMAYLITFEEYRHHFPDVRRARAEAMRSALLAFGLFAALGGISALLLGRASR